MLIAKLLCCQWTGVSNSMWDAIWKPSRKSGLIRLNYSSHFILWYQTYVLPKALNVPGILGRCILGRHIFNSKKKKVLIVSMNLLFVAVSSYHKKKLTLLLLCRIYDMQTNICTWEDRVKITSRTDNNALLSPQRGITWTVCGAEGAKTSQDTAGKTDTYSKYQPLPGSHSKRMDQDQKPSARELKCAHVSCFQTAGHFISDGFTAVSCRLQEKPRVWWCSRSGTVRVVMGSRCINTSGGFPAELDYWLSIRRWTEKLIR